MSAANPLPPLYAAWMQELLGATIPAESEATCDHCAMLPAADGAAPGVTEFFHPQTKCCAYQPLLPNFLTGQILADPDPATVSGRATVVERLRAGLNVTPLGLENSAVFVQLYTQGENLFGHSRAWRCPHYLEAEGGLCGIWRSRSAICSTWFCKHVRGATGLQFWQTLRDLLRTVEVELARWCILELVPDNRALSLLFPSLSKARAQPRADASQTDGVVNPERQRALWGTWFGREEEFYRACAEKVSALTWGQVVTISGPAAQAYARLTVEAFHGIQSTAIPARLRVGSCQVIQMNTAGALIVSYSSYDPLLLSPRLLRTLIYFDGRPTGQARRLIAEKERVELSDELVRLLVDARILIADE